MKNTPHRSTTPGKRVRIITRDGRTMQGKYQAMHSKHITIKINDEIVKINHDDIKQFMVIKGLAVDYHELK